MKETKQINEFCVNLLSRKDPKLKTELIQSSE